LARGTTVNSLFAAGAELQCWLDARGWPFCFIGGVANFRWGTPRLTAALDLTLLTGFGTEAPFVGELLDAFEGRIADAAEFAEANRVLLLRSAGGVPIDVALGAMPFEEAAIARSSNAELAPGAVLRTCSAEDLIVHKAFAARAQDLVDIEGVLVRQRGVLVWPQLLADLHDLAAMVDRPEIPTEVERIARRAESVIGAFSRMP
jgi:hypothetical protein